MKIEMPCIVCPMSCHIEIEEDENGNITSIKGNHCLRGKHYVLKELTHPERILTSTVKINNALYPRCPVMTSSFVPKEKMLDLMKIIKDIEVNAPVLINEIILKDIDGLNVDIIATRTLEKVR